MAALRLCGAAGPIHGENTNEATLLRDVAMRVAKIRSTNGTYGPGHPTAIWSAFARQAAWKSWVIVVLLALLGLSLLVDVRLATRPPEFVVVENPGGKATLVRQSVATDELLRFLAERTRPPDLAVVRFTREFLELAFAVNSSTIEDSWPKALSMMTPSLRTRVEREAGEARLIETYAAAQVRTDLTIDDVLLVQRANSLLQVEATLSRRRAPLLGGGSEPAEHLAVDLVEEFVPATLEHPDGLAVAEWQVREAPESQATVKP